MSGYREGKERTAGGRGIFRRLLIGAALIGIMALSGCGTRDSGVTEIRVAFNQNEEHPQYRSMKKLGEEFEKATNGRYHMTIYPNGILGNQPEMAEFMRTGALQMAMVPVSVMEGYDPDYAIVGAPYLYDDLDHQERVVFDGVLDELFKSSRKFQLEPLTVYTSGERNVYAKKPVNSMADLKGMIIRVNDSATYIRMVELMGGSGSIMAQSEVYTALQQGVIDAAENSERVYCDFKHYEVSPYYIYTKHLVFPDLVVASTQFLDSMSEEDRAIFDRLIKESTEMEYEEFKKSIEQAKQDAADHGTTFCYPDVEEFRTACEPLLEEIAGRSDVTKRIYERVEALREGDES